MSRRATLRPVSARDRTVTLVLVLAAIVGWLLVAVVFTTVSPVGDAGAQALGALVLGAAVGLTAWPLLSARRLADDATAWYTAALAGPFWFVPLRRLFEAVWITPEERRSA